MMTKVSFPAPALYGDHHVQEVRRILLALPGVIEIYASSCFRVIEVSFDPLQVSAEEIASRLEKAGYLADLPTMGEMTGPTPARHTVMVEQTRSAVGFQQEISVQKRSAWPCPGMGLLKSREDARG
jgi:hypothetical protein